MDEKSDSVPNPRKRSSKPEQAPATPKKPAPLPKSRRTWGYLPIPPGGYMEWDGLVDKPDNDGGGGGW
jgi:hypothetical protein